MTKDKLIKWMDNQGHTKEWLAEKCGVKLATINSWRSNRPIPGKASLIIANLIKEDNRTQHSENSLNIKFNDDQLELIERAAAIVQTPTREYIIRAAIARARQDSEKITTHLQVADTETPYTTTRDTPSNILDPSTEGNSDGGEANTSPA